VDCFGARGRAEESFSFQWAKSPHLRQKSLEILLFKGLQGFFYIFM
jgi:hypothetical protein